MDVHSYMIVILLSFIECSLCTKDCINCFTSIFSFDPSNQGGTVTLQQRRREVKELNQVHLCSIRTKLKFKFLFHTPSLTQHAVLYLFVFTDQGWQTMPVRGMMMQVPTKGLSPQNSWLLVQTQAARPVPWYLV